jgi:amino-acid N-acetyltransferase
VNSEELVKRTRADIIAHLEDYWVLEIDRNLVGCVALHFYGEQKIAELACLYVHKNQEGQGYGRKLMAFAEQLAVEKGAQQLVALSTQAFNYFQQKGGYLETTPDILPPERRKKYDAGARNSKVMVKALGIPR